MKYSRAQIAEWAIDGFVTLASVLLVLMVAFELVAADRNATFIHWVYVVSTTLMTPFREVFAVNAPAIGHPLDVAALFAIVAYLVGGYVFHGIRGWATRLARR